MRSCGHCGSALNDADAFCLQCGHHVEPELHHHQVPAVPADPTTRPRGTARRVIRDGSAELLYRLAMLGAAIALALWLWHLATDAQLGSARPRHSTLIPAAPGTAISSQSTTLAWESLLALVAALALGTVTVLLTRNRAYLARRAGWLLFVTGVIGVVYALVVPQLIADHPGARLSTVALERFLRAASPALGIYITSATIGLGLFVGGWYGMARAIERRRAALDDAVAAARGVRAGAGSPAPPAGDGGSGPSAAPSE